MPFLRLYFILSLNNLKNCATFFPKATALTAGMNGIQPVFAMIMTMQPTRSGIPVSIFLRKTVPLRTRRCGAHFPLNAYLPLCFFLLASQKTALLVFVRIFAPNLVFCKARNTQSIPDFPKFNLVTNLSVKYSKNSFPSMPCFFLIFLLFFGFTP